jgi:polysaccharide export outer membrane protein
MYRRLVAFSFVALGALSSAGVHAQKANGPNGGSGGNAAGHAAENAVVTSAATAGRPAVPGAGADTVDPSTQYVIGAEDVLSIVFWRDKEMSTQVRVRPDGKISLPLLDEIQAAGLTPAALRTHLIEESKRFFGNPAVTVVVQEINSRKVFVTGQVVKPGSYVIATPTTVLQVIAMAGGLKDFADSKNITIVRKEGGRESSFAFNYKDIRKNLKQNIELKPGDTVVVP